MSPDLIKKILSVFLVYHLLVIVVLPNCDSILGRKLSPWLTPYANTLGLNTSWRFFSPEPSPTIYYVYDADTAESPARAAADQFWQERGFITGRWPPEQPQGMLAENIRRLVYHSRFTTMNAERVEKFMGSLLCRFFPQAPTVSVRAVLQEIPSIEKSALGSESFSESARERTLETFEFSCVKGAP